MQELFQNKYRIPSVRLQTWNYANAGMYFVTICTQNRKGYFGEIVNGEIQLSEIGKIAETEWIKTVDMRPDMNLELGEFVVMNNHFHGIIIIGENQYNLPSDTQRRDAMHRVSTNHFAAQSKNLASIIRGYKSAVTIYARKKISHLHGNHVFTTI
ncbi:MAG: hypothetical protein WCV67_10855 [Victivallaceae bacterium]|jgi:REP element-mobilizing transposase RayT